MFHELDTQLEELSLKSSVPTVSMVFSNAEIQEWASQIWEAVAGQSVAYLCVVTLEDEVEKLASMPCSLSVSVAQLLPTLLVEAPPVVSLGPVG